MPSVCCKPPQGGYYPCFTENWNSVVKPLVEGLWTNLDTKRIHIFLTPDPHFFKGFPPNPTSASNKQTNKRRLDHWAETWFHLPGKCLRSSSQGEWSLSKKWLDSACLPRPSVVAKAAVEGLLYSFKKDFWKKKKRFMCLPACMDACGARGDQKRRLSTLELAFRWLLAVMWVLGTKQVPGKSSRYS